MCKLLEQNKVHRPHICCDKFWQNRKFVTIHTSVAAAKAAKICGPKGVNSLEGRDPKAAAAPRFTATLGSVSRPKYFTDVRWTASDVSLEFETDR